MKKLLTLIALLTVTIGANAGSETLASFAFVSSISNKAGNSTDNETDLSFIEGECTVTWSGLSTTATTITDGGSYYTSGYKLNSSTAYIQIALSTGSFQTGDVVTVYMTTDADDKTDGVYVVGTGDTNNSITATMATTSSLYTASYTLTSTDIQSDGSLNFIRYSTHQRIAGISVYRSAGVTIAASGVSTFSAECNMTIPDGVTAYQAAYSSGTTVTLTKLEGTVIPANTGVVVKGTASSNVTFTATTDENSAGDFTDNGLIAASYTKDVSIENYPTDLSSNTQYYALTNGYWYLIDTSVSVSDIPANKAILYIESGVSSSAPLSVEYADNTETSSGSETTGISNVTAASMQADGVYYNLQGMRVGNPTSGLYIVNGKKVIIK